MHLKSCRSFEKYEQIYPIKTKDEFGPKFFGPGQKWALKIIARPGHGLKLMLAVGPGRAWAKFKIDGPGWARLGQAGPGWARLGQAKIFL